MEVSLDRMTMGGERELSGQEYRVVQTRSVACGPTVLAAGCSQEGRKDELVEERLGEGHGDGRGS